MKQPTEYQLWKEGHKLSLKAFTDEEIFNFGFEAGKQISMTQEQELQSLSDSTQELLEPKKEKNAKSKIQKDSAPE